MELLTQTLREQLLANGRKCEVDHWPVVKFFSPTGAATWLLSELQSDGDRLFGLCDLGFGCPELGYVSLSEIESVRLPLGLRVERDILFAATHPLSVCAKAARAHGRITERSDHLAEAALALAREDQRSPP